jgi:hypothetical protein
MKRMLMTLAAVAGLAASAGSARADWGGYTPPTGSQGMPMPPATPAGFNAPGTLMGLGAPVPGQAPDYYGVNPALRRSLRLGHGCDTCGHRGLFGHKDGCGRLGHGGHGHGLFGHGGGHGGFGHGGGGFGHGGGGGYGYGPQQPAVMQGTLVFPNHTFIRSPRDFFMYEPNR